MCRVANALTGTKAVNMCRRVKHALILNRVPSDQAEVIMSWTTTYFKMYFLFFFLWSKKKKCKVPIRSSFDLPEKRSKCCRIYDYRYAILAQIEKPLSFYSISSLAPTSHHPYVQLLSC